MTSGIPAGDAFMLEFVSQDRILDSMGTFSKTLISGVALLAAAGPALSAHTSDHASRLSWFNEAPFAGAGPVGVPEARLMKPSDYSTFGVRLRASAEEAYAVNAPAPVADTSAFRLYGEVESPRAGKGSFAALQDASPGRVNVFGVSWQHRLNAMNTLALSAEYGESTVVTPGGVTEYGVGTAASPLAAETFDTRAALSWTSRLPLAASPSITGSVYLGDAMAREENFRYLGRRYYGFTVGGSLTLFQSHTPYVSFKMQRSLYEPVTTDPLATTTTTVFPRSGDRSLLSAGWKWQAGRDFSLQAEASYGLGETPGTSLDPYSLERSRILFGTRFGFK